MSQVEPGAARSRSAPSRLAAPTSLSRVAFRGQSPRRMPTLRWLSESEELLLASRTAGTAKPTRPPPEPPTPPVKGAHPVAARRTIKPGAAAVRSGRCSGQAAEMLAPRMLSEPAELFSGKMTAATTKPTRRLPVLKPPPVGGAGARRMQKPGAAGERADRRYSGRAAEMPALRALPEPAKLPWDQGTGEPAKPARWPRLRAPPAEGAHPTRAGWLRKPEVAVERADRRYSGRTAGTCSAILSPTEAAWQRSNPKSNPKQPQRPPE